MSKVGLRYLFSPKGTNSIDGGTAPGWQPPFDQPCKGCITPMRCNPCRVGRRFDLYRGRCPRLLNLSPSGTRSDDDGVLTQPLNGRASGKGEDDLRAANKFVLMAVERIHAMF